MKKYISIFLLFLFVHQVNALTVRSVSHGDWSNPSTWSTGQLPSNPDTIVISHYVTFGADLTINAPSVLLIEGTGTLCGDYLLNLACGTYWINNGSVFVNRFIVRNGINYCTISTRAISTVTGCPTGQWSVVPAKGNLNIVPWTACKAADTNWEIISGVQGGCTVGMREYTNLREFTFFPNPVNDKLQIESSETSRGSLIVMDVSGRYLILKEVSSFQKIEMDLSDFGGGIYFLNLITKNYTVVKKIIKN